MSRVAKLRAEIVEWAKAWRNETCSDLPGCDPHDGSHDGECEIARNERDGISLVDALAIAEVEENQEPLDLEKLRSLCAKEAEPWSGEDSNECPGCGQVMYLSEWGLERVGLCQRCREPLEVAVPALLDEVELLRGRR